MRVAGVVGHLCLNAATDREVAVVGSSGVRDAPCRDDRA